jgi:hypothetical protein
MNSHGADNVAVVDPGSNDLLIGQKLAFAAASLILGVCSFITLLGMEKAILAIIFAVLATRNGPASLPARRGFARFGLALGVVQIVFVIGALIFFRDRIVPFFEYLERFNAGN